jgi:hypothetical protein
MQPRSSPERREQLRRAKQAQRVRERARGLVHVQFAAPRALASKFAAAARQRGFEREFEDFLDRLVIRIADYAALREITWSLTDEFLTAREAFAVYERNWRFVDVARLDSKEARLLQTLTNRYGAGILNA